jgi:hypothetical protein
MAVTSDREIALVLMCFGRTNLTSSIAKTAQFHETPWISDDTNQILVLRVGLPVTFFQTTHHQIDTIISYQDLNSRLQRAICEPPSVTVKDPNPSLTLGTINLVFHLGPLHLFHGGGCHLSVARAGNHAFPGPQPSGKSDEAPSWPHLSGAGRVASQQNLSAWGVGQRRNNSTPYSGG